METALTKSASKLATARSGRKARCRSSRRCLNSSIIRLEIMTACQRCRSFVSWTCSRSARACWLGYPSRTIKTLPMDRPVRWVDYGGFQPRSYRGTRPPGCRCTPLWVRTSEGRRYRRLAWCVLSWVMTAWTASCDWDACCRSGGLTEPSCWIGVAFVAVLSVPPECGSGLPMSRNCSRLSCDPSSLYCRCFAPIKNSMMLA